MTPEQIGGVYDAIAPHWAKEHARSQYGVAQLQRALNILGRPGDALDVGCGAGGRLVRVMQENGLHVQGLDISAHMLEIFGQRHPELEGIHASITDWQTEASYDFILAWDSLFHLPYKAHEPVLRKLATHLKVGGVLLYTLGDAVGEHEDTWLGQRVYYSSLGIIQNLSVLAAAGLVCKHLELDQWPQNHVYIIAQKVCDDTGGVKAV
ncbi:MAG: class I SAM-dependent methyltransferase [Oleiphilaceae bacterium]|nr:class I SAM-dependent methyltransferase [Oleiphilaceae bacterium]